MNKNVEVLEEVLEVLEAEKKNFYDLVNQNQFRIEEINSYLKELSKKEDEDYKVFSPRNIENIHREQIQSDVNEKKKYEDENIEFQKKIEFLKSLIDKVNIVIENLLTVENSVEKFESSNSVSEHCDETYKELENIKSENRHLAHQILNCITYIVSDTERTKVELNTIAKKMIE